MNGADEIVLDAHGEPVDPASLVGREFVHFKGNRYRLEAFAVDSETLAPMAVYRPLYGEAKLWVRPAKMFFETVDRPGYHGPRFRLADAARGSAGPSSLGGGGAK